MAGAEAGVTVMEVRDMLAACEAADTGCFGGNPEAFIAMKRGSVDAGDQITTLRMAQAATAAGEAGVPFEDVTYTPWRIVVDDEARQEEITRLRDRGRHDPVVGPRHKLVDDDPARIVDHLGDESAPGNRRAQIARCAHACGMAGLENCPVMLG